MLLSLEDERVRIRLARVMNNRLRLTMDFPREPHYRNRVLAAHADFLSGPPRDTVPQNPPRRAEEGDAQ